MWDIYEEDEESLEALDTMYRDLQNGTHYSKHEQALTEMFGANPDRQIYLPES